MQNHLIPSHLFFISLGCTYLLAKKYLLTYCTVCSTVQERRSYRGHLLCRGMQLSSKSCSPFLPPSLVTRADVFPPYIPCIVAYSCAQVVRAFAQNCLWTPPKGKKKKNSSCFLSQYIHREGRRFLRKLHHHSRGRNFCLVLVSGSRASNAIMLMHSSFLHLGPLICWAMTLLSSRKTCYLSNYAWAI